MGLQSFPACSPGGRLEKVPFNRGFGVTWVVVKWKVHYTEGRWSRRAVRGRLSRCRGQHVRGQLSRCRGQHMQRLGGWPMLHTGKARHSSQPGRRAWRSGGSGTLSRSPHVPCSQPFFFCPSRMITTHFCSITMSWGPSWTMNL